MKKKAFFYFLVGIVILLAVSGFSKRDDTLDAIIAHLEKIRNNYPQEKVHLHFDKGYYSVGEDIWFKAYVVNAEKNELSALSRVLYVDVLDDTDSIRKTLVLPVINGLSRGDINLSDSLFSAGSYHIRAYTRWMSNFDPDYFFNKTVLIGDALKSPVNAVADFTLKPGSGGRLLTAGVVFKNLNNEPLQGKTVSYSLSYQKNLVLTGKAQTDEYGKMLFTVPLKSSIGVNGLVLNTFFTTNGSQSVSRSFKVTQTPVSADVKFFPEGGELVNGLRTKIGFKVVGVNGLGLAVSGYIEDQDAQRIIEIRTKFAGMGVFALQPLAAKSYTAVITFPDGFQKRFALPVARDSGYMLSLNHLSGDSLAISIGASPPLINKEVMLIAQCNATIQYITKVKCDRAMTTFLLPESRFTTGIVQFTLFAADRTPVAERLIFVGQHRKLNLSVDSDKAFYSRRQKVKMDIAVMTSKGEPIQGSFSVAVTDQGKLSSNEDEETTILSNLLLTSDLKGYIEKPNYYFTNVDKEKINQLDALMLTQGWRRFIWADVQAGKYPPILFTPESGLSVGGSITSLSGKSVPYGKVTLFGSSKYGPVLADTVADAGGRFLFEGLDFPDSTKFVVKAKSAKDRNNVRIVLNKEPAAALNSYKGNGVLDGVFNTSFTSYLKSTERRFDEMFKYGRIDKTIQLKEVRVRDRRPPKIYRSKFPADLRADITLTPDKLQSAGHLTNLLRSYGGILIKNNAIYGIRRGEGKMLVLLDGRPIDDIDGISPMALAGVQIIKGGGVSESLGMLAGGIYASQPLPPYPHVASAYYGVVYLTTERRATKYNTPQQASVSYLKPKGFALTRKFYAPAYDMPGAGDKMSDLRSTIYWKPDIITNEQGKASIAYFTADEPGTYRVVIEGLDLNGNLLRHVSCLKVK